MPDLVIRLALLAAVLGACPPAAQAQASGGAWYTRLWPVGGGTMLAVRADTGQEVRRGRRGIRHGRRVPLVVDDTNTVHFDIGAGANHASRWVLRRRGTEVHIEHWERRGPAGTEFELVRELVHALESSRPEGEGSAGLGAQGP